MENVYTTDQVVIFIGTTIFFIILFSIRNDFPKNSSCSPSNSLPSFINKPIKYLLASSALSVIIISIVIIFTVFFIGIEKTILFIEEEYRTCEKYILYCFIILDVIIMPFVVRYIDID